MRTAPMTENEKLRMRICHWIEHNREHAEQLLRNAEAAGDAARDIAAAADAMVLANRHLEAALQKLGGVCEPSLSSPSH